MGQCLVSLVYSWFCPFCRTFVGDCEEFAWTLDLRVWGCWRWFWHPITPGPYMCCSSIDTCCLSLLRETCQFLLSLADLASICIWQSFRAWTTFHSAGWAWISSSIMGKWSSAIHAFPSLLLVFFLYPGLGPVSRKPRKGFGPVKPFSAHLYLKTEKCMRLKLLVWREPLFILRICE